MEPRLRKAAALRSLGRLVEAGQEYERVVGMDKGCQEAQEGLRHCRQETGDRNISELENIHLGLGIIKGGGGDGRKNKKKNKKTPNVFIAVQARILSVIFSPSSSSLPDLTYTIIIAV